MVLSQRRADSVKNWLVAAGAFGGVLFAKGLGESKPIALNENPDGHRHRYHGVLAPNARSRRSSSPNACPGTAGWAIR